MAKMPLGRQKTPVADRSATPGWEKLCRPASHSLAVRQIFDQQPTSGLLKNSQAAQKGPDARRRPTVAREVYSLYVERATEGANEADGPFSAAC